MLSQPGKQCMSLLTRLSEQRMNKKLKTFPIKEGHT